MTEGELARIQVEAAMEYLHRVRDFVKLDRKSCITMAKLVKGELIKLNEIIVKKRERKPENGTI